MKKDHLLDIINCIRKHGPITVQRISEMMNLSVSTVNTVVTRLYMMQLISPEENTLATGGRRATAYRFVGNLNYCVGLALRWDYISLALIDANLDIVCYRDEPISILNTNLDSAVHQIADAIRQLITQYCPNPENVSGVGISVPGPVDFDNGIVIEIPGVPAWKHVPLRDILGKILDMRVTVDNDNNCCVLYLHEIDKLAERKNMIFLSTYPTGISAGLMLNGEVFRGSCNIAGEIGHISINPHGPKCPCGNRGCLELYASDKACVVSARSQISAHPKSLLFKRCEGVPERIDIDMMVESALEGDEFVQNLFSDTAYYIATAIDIAIKAYNPSMIVLQSMWLYRMKDIKNQMVEDIFMRSSFIHRTNVIITTRFSAHIYESAAAAMAMTFQFSPYESSHPPRWLIQAEDRYIENPFRGKDSR